MLFQLHRDNLNAVSRKPVPVCYDNVKIDCGYELDLLVEDMIVVELKSVSQLANIHQAQLLTYLKLSGYPVGLLINFNVERLVDGVKRMINPHPDPRFAEGEDKPQR